MSSYHRGVATADELTDLMKDAFTVDTFVYGAPLHDDGYSQKDLLANVLLETGEKEWNQRCEYIEEKKKKTFSKETPKDRTLTDGY